MVLVPLKGIDKLRRKARGWLACQPYGRSGNWEFDAVTVQD